MSLEQIKEATGGTLVQGNWLGRIKGVSIDSRTIKKGDIFFAIKGDRFDGHQFIGQAITSGAYVIVASKPVSKEIKVPVIRVKDTTGALGDLASFYRDRFSIPVIAITGSCGKTTTKEILADILGAKFKVLRNARSENNQFGVPLTLLKLKPSHDMAVLEFGTNQPGDIQRLAQIAKPTVSVLTNIGDSHLQKLKDRSGVFKEKYQLVRYMSPNGYVIFNHDDEWLRKIDTKKDHQKKITFAIHQKADYRADHISILSRGNSQFYIRKNKFDLKSIAYHNVYNSLAAISCGFLFKVSLDQMASRIRKFKFRNSRFETKNIGPLTVVNDTYNANPLSLMSAVETMNQMPARGKKILILGDMLELGKQSKRLHHQVGELIARTSIQCVMTFGRDSEYITQSIRKNNDQMRAVHHASMNGLCQKLKGISQSGDVVLVKGSRAMRMERIVDFLEKNFFYP